MRLTEITEKDYQDVIVLAKEIYNFDYLLTEKNDEFNLALSKFVTSTISRNTTHGSFIETDSGKRIGMMTYSIPGFKLLFSSLDTDYETNLNIFKKYLRDNRITNNQKLIIKKEIDVARSFEVLFNEYQGLLQNKVEIKLLYVSPEYRGKSLSKILFRQFSNDLLKSIYDGFYLFTTTEHNYKFYEKLKLKGLEAIIYDNNTSPEFLQYKFKLPYKALVYMGNRAELLI